MQATIPAKITALSFILLILAGNIWVIKGLVGAAPEAWLQLTFFVGILGAFVGGLGMGGLWLLEWRRRL